MNYNRQMLLLMGRKKRALITLNGKDFVFMILPRTELQLHYGLIWLRGFQVTKKIYESVMDVIGLFLKRKGVSIANTYYGMPFGLAGFVRKGIQYSIQNLISGKIAILLSKIPFIYAMAVP